MSTNNENKFLRAALVLVGLIFIFGIYTLGTLWPSGWVWHDHGQNPYLQMFWGVYATLGIFLLIASRKPSEHRSLIWFTVWSSVVHAVVMAVQAIVYPQHRGHLYGDVPALLIVAIVLAIATRSSTPASERMHGWLQDLEDDLIFALSAGLVRR